MKKIIYSIFIATLFSGTPIVLSAQNIYKEQINVNSSQLQQKGDSLYVSMQIDIEKLDIDNQRSLTLTPLLSSNGNQRTLPPVLINGSTRHKVYERSINLKKDQAEQLDFYKVVKENSLNNTIQYNTVIPYESWMETSQLQVKEDLCGCGGHQQETYTETLAANFAGEVKAQPYIPILAYIEPRKEEIKERSSKWETALDFPVNQSTILPNYMNNLYELSKVEEKINSIKSDNSIQISKIIITGFASPEGSVAINEKLSKERAEALKNYLAQKLAMPSDIYQVQYGGENWDGLVSLLNASDISRKEGILDIIRNTDNVDSRKSKLKTFAGGSAYKELLTNVYPKLRKVVGEAYYTVKNYTVDETKANLKDKANQLSLSEIYQLANTYPEGSPSFAEAFETAAKTYPDNAIANLNYAAALLSQKDTQNAKIYLDKSDKNSPEYSNNLGVYYLLLKDTGKAKVEFEKASKAGIPAAKVNLKQLETAK
ncbi:DUF3868 domain-containing protein [Dysgonomonas macrotermitis]|uniref:OmpA family protein n=1 Tax=Dysgonomonas macrotermitis TaxID=1346286 RepID=A0A1M5FQR9_9BACT|nr:DUF3868 domain-containing protein [Dysgonomonas macrotermitis]SHF93855.1 OmpA family protein [Dysgonomonas macrotermitis]